MGANTVTKGKASKAHRKVGFYGCNGALVRLEHTGTEHPRIVRLPECPGCGHCHTSKVGWRRWVPSIDEGKEAIAV